MLIEIPRDWFTQLTQKAQIVPDFAAFISSESLHQSEGKMFLHIPQGAHNLVE